MKNCVIVGNKFVMHKIKLIDQLPFSYHCKSVILGTLLGDGSLKIQKGYKNARLTIKHSIVQKAYFYWKVSQLLEISSSSSVQVLKPTGFSSNVKLSFQSRSLESLTKLHYYLYDEGSLKIQRRWLNKLTPLSIMVWWLDDGSLISRGRKGVICTDGFKLEEIKVLVRYFRIVWDINFKIYPLNKSSKVYYRIYLTTTELKKFFLIFLNLIPIPEMLYKVSIRYNDPIFQQRWTSELLKALPQFKEKILKSEGDIVHINYKTN